MQVGRCYCLAAGEWSSEVCERKRVVSACDHLLFVLVVTSEWVACEGN